MQSQIDRVKSNILDSLLFRLFLFVVTFVMASLSVLGVQSFSVFTLIVAFPSGLIAVLTQNFNEMPKWSNNFGWLIYISITLFGILTKNRRLFVFIYIIFVILLIINVAGCNELRQNINIGF